jgi:hypothetical protein|tara:strand:+ start:102 stop:341 length:240 start_codon:yes stop_codon:yes gene_type:complete
MAKKIKKISKKELEILNELQKEINNVLAQIGNAEAVKSQFLEKHKEIQQKWNENANALEAIYGKVNVDLSSGEIKEIEG